MELLQTVRETLLTTALIFLALALALCLLRAVLGPRFTDRVVVVNLIGTFTILIISTLSIYMDEAYLVDVALVYALISFLAVVVLVNTYLSSWKKQRERKTAESADGKEERI